MDGLGGGLVGAAGPGDHGGVGGLAVKALRLLGGPHGDLREGRGTLGLQHNDLPHIRPR